MNYIFPFQLVKKDTKIILYGAGNVGLRFYKQLKTTGYAQVELWVDKNWEDCKKRNLPVCSVDRIFTCREFDYIVIGIENEKIAEEVIEMLVTSFAVDKEKIIYSKYYGYEENGLYKDVQEESRSRNLKEELIQIDPKEMVQANRLDLIVRYLLAKDLIYGIENRANCSLYTRMILVRTNGFEGEGYFSQYKREGTEEYLSAFRTVCRSMEKNGFDDTHFIPVGNNEVLLNGAHRTAAALALEQKIWIKYYLDQAGNTDLDMRWFEDHGFNTEDKIRILRGYADLYENCGIMLLFGPCMEQWNYLQAQLSRNMKVVGTVELDFSDNYIAFENLFREIYSDPLWRNLYIDRKVELLKMAPLKIRVLLVSDEGFKQFDLYKTMNVAKIELRDRLYFDTDIAPVVMHGSDSVGEFEHLKQIVLSVNNLKHLKMRLARNYSEEFIKQLETLKVLLAEKGIPISDVCISGSSGMEIFGLRKAQDIDFIVADRHRRNYGENTCSWTDCLEYVRINSIQTAEDMLYRDELLINDDNYHYIFNGLKFVNLNIIAAKKKFNAREKDLKDVRLYELFKDYVANFDDKMYLKSQIEHEFYKKR